ncbi:MAG: hypothetical protein NC212_00330 [Staphylococcus sp.]|nr:hypothetical protein [Staphylococcus sp.]
MEATALIVFLIVASLLFWLHTKYELRYLEKNGVEKPLKPIEVAVATAIMIAVCGCMYYFVPGKLCSRAFTVISILATLLLAIITYWKSAKYKTVPRTYRYHCVMVSLALCSLINCGVIFLCRWSFPDVTTVYKADGKYTGSTTRAFPFADGLKPTGSYVSNDTDDTLYRVVVSYAFLGEEINNHYNVTDTIAPKTTVRVSCPPNYVGRRIFPIMLATSGRFGKSRTRRSYIVDGEALHEFQTADFSCLGIKENIRVATFDITSNPIVWEDSSRIEALERNIKRFYRPVKGESGRNR